MNERIKEMAQEICAYCVETCGQCDIEVKPCETVMEEAEHLYNAGYRKQKEFELREEVTTDDFHNLELAEERGYHRKKFYCPNCDLLIKTETWDSKYMFGNSTVLKTNEMPKFCPNCGEKMKGGAE